MRIAVIGTGTVGAQVLRQLSLEPGVEAHGFDSSYPGHPSGAAGGESRLFRSLEFGDPAYQWAVVDHAGRAWRDFEAEVGLQLIERTGALIFGNFEDDQLQTLVSKAESSSEAFELLEGRKLAERHPQFDFAEDDLGLWDPQGGIIRPELSVLAAARLAERNGAKVHEYSRVDSVKEHRDHVELFVRGKSLFFDRIVVAGGGGTTALLPHLRSRMVTRRLVSVWYQSLDSGYLKGITPFLRTSPSYCYGLPTPQGRSMKVGIGFNDHGLVSDPDSIPENVTSEVLKKFEWITRDVLPGLDPRPLRTSSYLESYTTTMQDYLSFEGSTGRVLVMAGFSGRGFKVSPVLGKIGAQAILSGQLDPALDFLGRAPEHFQITDAMLGTTTPSAVHLPVEAPRGRSQSGSYG